jgi:acetylglutamate kinase
MPSEAPPPDPASVVLTFLESVGRRSEAELYLRLFRGIPKQSFAVIATEASVLRDARASVLDACAFLRDLGLFAPVVIGLSSSSGSERAARHLEGAARSLRATVLGARTPRLAETLASELADEHLPIVHTSALASATAAERYAWLGDLMATLESRKVVVLRRRGGLGPHGTGPLDLGAGHVLQTHRAGISLVNATTDVSPLRKAKVLAGDEVALLDHLVRLVTRPDLRTVASVTSPLTMLQELFTQKGAGTLVKRGSVIQTHRDYATVERGRLEALLTSTFGAPLVPGFFDRAVDAVLVEESYRGAAIIEPGTGAAFLTKFAVEPVAQGEGMGHDLWQAVVRRHPSIYWRARMDNPVASWYATLADGTMKHGSWRVYWRGVTLEDVPRLVADATDRPVDFVRPAT